MLRKNATGGATALFGCCVFFCSNMCLEILHVTHTQKDEFTWNRFILPVWEAAVLFYAAVHFLSKSRTAAAAHSAAFPPQINQESREPAEVFPLILPLKSIIKQRWFFLKQRKVFGFNFYYLSPRKMFSDILMCSGRRWDLPTRPTINPTIGFSLARLIIIKPCAPPHPAFSPV